MGLTITAIVCAYNEAGSFRPVSIPSWPRPGRPTKSSSSTTPAPTTPAPWRARVPGVRVVDEPRQGPGGGARDRAPRGARPTSLAYVDADCRAPLTWLERVEAQFAKPPAPVGGDRPVPLLRLGLERPRADPRLRPAGRAADPRARAPRCSASARFSTAATSRSGATRSRAIGGFDRTHRVPRRGHQPRPPADAARARRAVPATAGSGPRRAATARWASARCSACTCATSGRRSCAIVRPIATHLDVRV